MSDKADDDLEPYENTLSLEALRREVREGWDTEGALVKALRDLPEVPPYDVLLLLSRAAKYPDDWEIGARLQRQERKPIPYKTECELGAGLWWRIRKALTAPSCS